MADYHRLDHMITTFARTLQRLPATSPSYLVHGTTELGAGIPLLSDAVNLSKLRAVCAGMDSSCSTTRSAARCLLVMASRPGSFPVRRDEPAVFAATPASARARPTWLT